MDLSVKQVVGVIIAIVIFSLLLVAGKAYTNTNTDQMKKNTDKAWTEVSPS
ncbi:MAG: hypothetical protein RR945_01495 [Erysipelotrichaceae bacterium]